MTIVCYVVGEEESLYGDMEYGHFSSDDDMGPSIVHRKVFGSPNATKRVCTYICIHMFIKICVSFVRL